MATINAPCFPLTGPISLSACFRDALGRHQAPDAIVQASAIHLHVGDGELCKHCVPLSEHNISVPVQEQLPHLRGFFASAAPQSRDVVPRVPPNPDVKRFLGSDRYFRFDLPAVFEQLFGPFRSLFRGNIDEEKSLSLVAIQPG